MGHEIITFDSMLDRTYLLLSNLLEPHYRESGVLCDWIQQNKFICMYKHIEDRFDSIPNSLFIEQMQKRQDLESMLSKLQHSLIQFGMNYAVIKGLSFESAIYGHHKVRDVGDIDILIKKEDVNQVHKMLLDLGYEQQLGPSSGSYVGNNKALFIARVSKQRYLTSQEPKKRFPYKDSYCPYVKEGCPTIEVHDGYRGLPKWYTRGIIKRACGNPNALVEDLTDTLILLLLNTYENAESFYSNYFDGKIVLRDFLDIACLFTLKRDEIDWCKAQETIRSLGIENKVGSVLYDLNELYPGEFDSILGDIPRIPSLWGLGLIERIQNAGSKRKSIQKIIREEIKVLAETSYIGIANSCSTTVLQASENNLVPSFALLKQNDYLELRIRDINTSSLVGTMFVLAVFPLDGEDNPLSVRAMIRIGQDEVDAYCEPFDKLTDGQMLWNDTSLQFEATESDPGELLIKMPLSAVSDLLQPGTTAISCGLYDRKYENVYWARNRGKHFLSGNVPIGFVSMFTDKHVSNVHVDFSVGIYVISTECESIAVSMLSLFENSGYGIPIDVDDREMRSCVINLSSDGQYEVIIEGEQVLADIDRNQAISSVLQDITDWYVRLLKEDELIVHAASNSIGDDAVMLMGSSGSGKTTLALALAAWWPLRGDECAKVSIKDGTTWIDPLPINLKAGNPLRNVIVGGNEGVACQSEIHGLTFSHDRRIVAVDPDPLLPKRIRAIVFPVFDDECNAKEIRSIEPNGFAESILQSVIGKHLPSRNFSAFVRMVSQRKIPLIHLRYSSAEDAASYLVEHIRKLEG